MLHYPKVDVLIVLIFVAIVTGVLTFVTLIWSQNLIFAVLGAMFVASGMTALAGAIIAAWRGADHAEPADEEWDNVTTDDQRRAARLQGFTRGRLRWDDGHESDCIIHDLSITGARLGIPNSVRLPDFVELEIASESRVVGARVRWRTADEVGVEFLEAGNALDSADLKEQNAALRAEIVRLRAMLEDRWTVPRQSRN